MAATARALPRMIDPDGPPGAAQLAAFLGKKAYGYWQRITAAIAQNYPGVFSPDWLFGKNMGWVLRYKKSKSFCTLVPERGSLIVQIVFGKEERVKVEACRNELSTRTWEAYKKATTYHDGKWLYLTVDSSETLKDVVRLLAMKRKPKV